MNQQKITVVGAGLAGLTSAYRIEKLTGQKVEIFEARKRAGGRVFTVCMGSSYEELGGKFINDWQEGEKINALIYELGLEIEEHEIAMVNRQFFWEEEVFPYNDLFKKAPCPDEKMYANVQRWSKECKNLGEVLDRFFSNNQILRHLREIHIRCYDGKDSKELATFYLPSFWEMYKEDYNDANTKETPKFTLKYVKGGNAKLVEKLSSSIHIPIHYDCPLRKISKEDGRLCLHFPKNKKVVTDFLVLAIPCSTLREVEIEEGIFPNDQMQAIKTLQYGTNAKILLPVSEPKKMGPFSYGKEAVFWMNKDNSITTLFFGGASGEFDAHVQKELSQKIEEELPAVKKVFPSILFPGGIDPVQVEDKQFGQYSHPVGISWLHEEYSKGSYSAFSPNQYELFKEVEEHFGKEVRKVFRPIDNKIFFAGEHTSIERPAYLEGAVESGEKAAHMIVHALKKKAVREEYPPSS